MPKITTEFKEAVQSLHVKDLWDLILKYARKDRAFYDFLNIGYLNNKEAEEELFDETANFITSAILLPGGRGVIQKQLKSEMDKCIRQINHYAKISKNKKREADLLLLLLETVMDNYKDELGTCFSAYDSKLALTTNRLLNLVTKKLHPDYFFDYKDNLNLFLRVLHDRSNHLDYVFNLPQTAESKHS